ncbi:MAG: hypothetical protein LH624_00030 [Cryobacterium sp.]|nr:hypothetical protein [Cryobacterium sp.]
MTTLHLSYVPVEASMHVYLNGLEVQRGQWTFNVATNSVVSAAGMEEASGDKLECRYAHSGQAAV